MKDKKRITLRLRRDQFDHLNSYSKKNGTTKSKYIKRLLNKTSYKELSSKSFKGKTKNFNFYLSHLENRELKNKIKVNNSSISDYFSNLIDQQLLLKKEPEIRSIIQLLFETGDFTLIYNKFSLNYDNLDIDSLILLARASIEIAKIQTVKDIVDLIRSKNSNRSEYYEAYCLLLEGRYNYLIFKHRTAEVKFKEVIQLCSTSSELYSFNTITSKIYLYLGSLYYKWDDINLALDNILMSLDLQSENDEVEKLISHIKLAQIYQAKMDNESSHAHYQIAKLISENSKNKYLQIRFKFEELNLRSTSSTFDITDELNEFISLAGMYNYKYCQDSNIEILIKYYLQKYNWDLSRRYTSKLIENSNYNNKVYDAAETYANFFPEFKYRLKTFENSETILNKEKPNQDIYNYYKATSNFLKENSRQGIIELEELKANTHSKFIEHSIEKTLKTKKVQFVR